MSRNPLAGESEHGASLHAKGVDTLTLSAFDAGRLKIPFGSLNRPRLAQQIAAPLPHARSDAVLEDRRQESMAQAGKPDPRRDVVVDVRACCEARPIQLEQQALIEIPGLFVPSGYAFFALALGLTNMLDPGAGGPVCVALSPLPMVCLVIHALGVQSWVAGGLLLCAWLVPSVCFAWRLAFALGFFVLLGVLMAAGTRRMLVSTCLVALLLSMLLATQTRWTGLDSRWGVTLGGFFLALQCVTASFGGGKVVYRIRQVT